VGAWRRSARRAHECERHVSAATPRVRRAACVPQQKLTGDAAVEHDSIARAECAHHRSHFRHGQAERNEAERCAEGVEARECNDDATVGQCSNGSARVAVLDVDAAIGRL